MAALMGIMLVAALLIGVYTFHFIKRLFLFFGKDVKQGLFRVLLILLTIAVVVSCLNMWSIRALIALHFLAGAFVMDIIAFVVRKIWRPDGSKLRGALRGIYRCAVIPIILISAVFSYGITNMQKIQKTEYSITTEKEVGDYTVLLITDTHYGTIQDPGLLESKLEEMNALDADLVILGGDIVEEGTSKERMEEVFARLGSLKSRYGTYYVYGNHDRQPYTAKKAYSEEELDQAITDAGIGILKDRYVEIQDDFILAGRDDAAWGNTSGRASTEEILKEADRNKFILMADHQPICAEENDAQGVDLEISGHTHAGQIWPVGWLSELTGVLNYGLYQKGNCQVIVSSGFTGWGYPVRTEEHCEYVVIHIGKENK